MNRCRISFSNFVRHINIQSLRKKLVTIATKERSSQNFLGTITCDFYLCLFGIFILKDQTTINKGTK